jgi:hypothetical protein
MGTGGEGGRVITYVETQKIKNLNPSFEGNGLHGEIPYAINKDVFSFLSFVPYSRAVELANHLLIGYGMHNS